MWKFGIIALAALSLSACAQKSAYEAAVEDEEPRYCYRSLAGVTCYDKPNHRDEKRLVNYYGPAPMRYEKPAPAPRPTYYAPEAVNYWVKDPEPIPNAVGHGDLSDRPWLTKKAAVEAGPSASPESYRVRREGASYIIKEIPQVLTAKPEPAPEVAPKAEAEKTIEEAESGEI